MPHARTRIPPTRLGPLGLAVLLGACATPQEPAAERLDRETGTTLTRMPKPIELVATLHRGDGADPFAFVAPFVTNRMGAHSYFLWIASPGDRPIEGGPELYCDGAAVALGAGVPEPTAELSARPYEQPAPWSSDRYFEIDAHALRDFGACRQLELTVRYRGEGEVRFEGEAGPGLRDFVAGADVG
jgi:hypothetical protein